MKYPGTNNYSGSTWVGGKRCPIYNMWCHMRSRCYCSKLHEKRPTYVGCSVCEEWLEFDNFRSWVIPQQWEGKQLDKDIIEPGNKVYCPEKCAFVSSQLNSLLIDCGAARGEWPIGVCWSKQKHKFKTHIRINGKKQYIGYFDCPEDAHRAYVKRKIEYIQTFIDQETDPRIIEGLKKHQQRLSVSGLQQE